MPVRQSRQKERNVNKRTICFPYIEGHWFVEQKLHFPSIVNVLRDGDLSGGLKAARPLTVDS